MENRNVATRRGKASWPPTNSSVKYVSATAVDATPGPAVALLS